MNALLYILREHADQELEQPYIEVVHRLVQKVVIGQHIRHHPTELAVHGGIASILAAMAATSILESRFFHEQAEMRRRASTW